MVGAEEALAIGLVDEVVAPDDVYRPRAGGPSSSSTAPRWRWPRPRRPSTAGSTPTCATGLELEAEVFAALFATEDRRIGMESFVENGPGKAQFTGR